MRKIPVAAALLLAAACGGRGREPEALAVLPDFTMTAIGPETEAPFGRAEMLGSVWIADFIFTRCGGPCPLLTERMARLAGELPPGARFLSVSVDPEGDTPARLREYAAAFGARHPRWVFARGTAEQTYRLVYAGFRLSLSIDPKAEPQNRVTHSTRFALVDRRGAVRGFYDGLSDLDNAALARDARRLLEAGS